jgi:hypothetical protein
MFKFPPEWFDRVNREKEISQERGSGRNFRGYESPAQGYGDKRSGTENQ